MGDQETNRQLRERIGHKEFKAIQMNNPVPGKSPHVESSVTCSCGAAYCLICDSQCPKCLGIHIQPEPEVRLPNIERPHPWLHDDCLRPQIVTPFNSSVTIAGLERTESALKMICGPGILTR